MQFYSAPTRENDPLALPDCEAFEVTYAGEVLDGEGHSLPLGWYWWPCFPGCLPDGEPSGPFATCDEATADARDF